ncbi:unnamed protein product [Caenorhabditis sp. 36 PRJEB53466]|nr:unnamed protein product [Caenorhabditis sp. 36 PRJEB53466]
MGNKKKKQNSKGAKAARAAVRNALAAAAEEAKSREVKFQLRSSDKEIYEMTQEGMMQSKTLAAALENLRMKDLLAAPFPVNNVPGSCLRKIVEWCEHHKDDGSYKMRRNGRHMIIPPWDENFLQRLNNQELFDIICAANYLDIPKLMDFSCKTVANMAKGKSPEEMRIIFGIPTDEEDAEALLNLPGPSSSSN